jgi:hypothetical protein
MKKSTEEVAENVSSSSEVKEESSKESTPDLFEPKPVIMEDMSRLEDEDPWMKRKKEMNA